MYIYLYYLSYTFLNTLVPGSTLPNVLHAVTIPVIILGTGCIQGLYKTHSGNLDVYDQHFNSFNKDPYAQENE